MAVPPGLLAAGIPPVLTVIPGELIAAVPWKATVFPDAWAGANTINVEGLVILSADCPQIFGLIPKLTAVFPSPASDEARVSNGDWKTFQLEIYLGLSCVIHAVAVENTTPLLSFMYICVPMAIWRRLLMSFVPFARCEKVR